MTSLGRVALLATSPANGEVIPARGLPTTLGCHIILACVGVALPSFVLKAPEVVPADRRHWRREDENASLIALMASTARTSAVVFWVPVGTGAAAGRPGTAA